MRQSTRFSVLLLLSFLAACGGEGFVEGGDELSTDEYELTPPPVDYNRPRVLAWAFQLSNDQIRTALAKLPGVGAVLYSRNYDLAKEPGDWVAFVGNMDAARKVVAKAQEGAKFLAVIVNDERNRAGPSGSLMTPAQYRAQFNEIGGYLKANGQRVSMMGLMAVGNTLQNLTWSLGFDYPYMDALLRNADPKLNISPDLYAFNPNKVHTPVIKQAMQRYGGKWILSPAPFTHGWDATMQPIKPPEWVRISADPNVLAVAMWALVSPKDQDRMHGLLDKSFAYTSVGNQVMDNLPCPGCRGSYGTAGNTRFFSSCPAGQAVAGFTAKRGGAIDSIAPLCAALSSRSSGAYVRGAVTTGPVTGGAGGSRQTYTCPGNSVVYAIANVQTGTSSFAGRNAPLSFTWKCGEIHGTKTVHKGTSPCFGGATGRVVGGFACEAGKYLTGIRGRHNNTALGHLRFECKP